MAGAAATLYTRLVLDANDFKNGIAKASSSVGSFGKNIGKMSGTLTKFGGYAAVAAAAIKGFSAVMESNKAISDSLGKAWAGLRGALDSVTRSVSRLSFKNMAKEMKESAETARRLFTALKDLNDIRNGMSVIDSEMSLKRAETEAIVDDTTRPLKERMEANAHFQTAVGDALRAQRAFMMQNKESAELLAKKLTNSEWSFDEIVEFYKKKRTGLYKGKMSEKWKRLDMHLKEDDEKELIGYITSVYDTRKRNAEDRKAAIQMANKLRGEERKELPVKQKVKETGNALEELNKQIDAVKDFIKFKADVTELEGAREKLKSLEAEKKKLERTIEFRLNPQEKIKGGDFRAPVSPAYVQLVLVPEEIRKLQAEIASIDATLSVTIDPDAREKLQRKRQAAVGRMEDLNTGFALELPKAPMEAMSDYESSSTRLQEVNSALITSFGAVGNVVNALSGSFEASASGVLSWVSTVVSSVGQAVTALQGLIAAKRAAATANMQEATTGAAAAVSSIPFAGPALAVAAIASLVAAIAKIPKFAAGGIVGGSSYYGDRILARVNSGEMILNGAQQRTLYNYITNNKPEEGGGTVEFKIRGQELVGILNKHDRKGGRS